MRPDERAEFLAWLNRLSLEQLKEVSSHVNAVITFKRGAVLRYLAPGSQIVFEQYINGQRSQKVGTIVKLHRVSVVVELANAVRENVGVDMILGMHVGHGEYAPLQSVAPTPFEGAGVLQGNVFAEAETAPLPGDVPPGTYQQPAVEEEPFCRWCGERAKPNNPLIQGPTGELFHQECLDDFNTHEIPDLNG